MVDRTSPKYRAISRKGQMTLRRKKRAEFWEYKKGLSCIVCGNDNPLNLDFDHVDPSTKEFAISRGVTSGIARDRIEAELRKCVPMCRNCHNIKSIIDGDKLKYVDYQEYIPEAMHEYLRS